LGVGETRCLVVGNDVRTVGVLENRVCYAADLNAELIVDGLESGPMWRLKIGGDRPQRREPARRHTVGVKPTVHDVLGIRIDRAEDAGEDLKRQAVVEVQLQPITALAEVGNCRFPKLPRGDTDWFHRCAPVADPATCCLQTHRPAH
jgi:hypothetical protein